MDDLGISPQLLAKMVDLGQPLTVKPQYTRRFVKALRTVMAVDRPMTYTELAEIVGVTQPWLSNVSTGKVGCSLQTQLKICSALGLDPSAVYKGERDVRGKRNTGRGGLS